MCAASLASASGPWTTAPPIGGASSNATCAESERGIHCLCNLKYQTTSCSQTAVTNSKTDNVTVQ